MKTKINISKFKAFVVALCLVAFFAGGWILFVFSEIDKQQEITREINLQTIEIRKQIQQRDSIFNKSFSARE